MISVHSAHADDAGQTAAEVLRLGAGARIPAMGGAGAASVGEPAAMHFNPAGLTRVRNSTSLEITHQQLVENINMGNISFAQNIGSGRDVVGGGIRYIDYGGQDRIEFRGGGNPDDLTRVGSFTNTDMVLTGGYASSLSRSVQFGVTGKIIRQELADVKATAFAGDLGVQWSSLNYPLSLGMAVSNVGTDLTFDDVDEPLPSLVRTGLAYEFKSLNLKFALDGEHTFVSSETGFRSGFEWTIWNIMALRAGYNANVDVDNGLTGGLGFRFGNARVDYAILPFGVFGSVHRFSLVWNF